MKIKLSGEYTLAEIEVDLDQQLTPNELQPGATVLATNESTGGLERIVSHEELSRFFAVGPPVALPMPTDVVVERTLADPAFKQILQEADGKKGFDPEAEQMKIRDFLAGVTSSKMTTEQSVFHGSRSNTSAPTVNRIKCPTCLVQFDAVAFQNHACEAKPAELMVPQQEKPHLVPTTFRQRGDRDKHIRARHSHLDANSRLMMQMQKFQLETAAAQKAQGHNPEQQDNDGGASTLDVPSGSGFVSTEPGVAEIQYSIAPEQQDEMVCVPIDQVNNSFFMSHYMQAVPMEEDGSGQHIIVFEQPGQDMDMMSIYDQQQVGEPMHEGGVPQRAPEENARVVVVKNNPTKPIFSDTYM
ncbi:GD18648 [Drosophila simulans]|uniref:GD18648 n=1 Tax=Drosophila simulans TaxID=7240 RepID=B4QVY1_DROSI|nr:GD18648 [Drosophila simulans]